MAVVSSPVVLSARSPTRERGSSAFGPFKDVLWRTSARRRVVDTRRRRGPRARRRERRAASPRWSRSSPAPTRRTRARVDDRGRRLDRAPTRCWPGALGVAAIYQQPALFPDLTVAENIALGLEPGGAWRRIDWRERRARARGAAWRGSAPPIDPDAEAGALRMAEQQLVEIARALGADARVLIMDEPTAALAEPEAERLLRADARAAGAGGRHRLHLAPAGGGAADRRPRDRPARRRASSDTPAAWPRRQRRADPPDGRPRARAPCSRSATVADRRRRALARAAWRAARPACAT